MKKKAVVDSFVFLIELTDLNGRKKLPPGPELFTMLKY